MSLMPFSTFSDGEGELAFEPITHSGDNHVPH